MAHFQWFEHGTRTSIGELSSCQELFLLTWCNDEALTCVLKKIYVDRLSPHENKSTSLAEVEIAKGLFFYRFHYNPDTFQFTDASLHEKDPGQTLDEGRTCSSCEVTEEKSRACEVRLLGKIEHQGPEQFIKGVCFKGFSFGNVDYFLYDFVYIVEPGAKVQKPYIICQITSISTKNKSRRYKEIGAMIKPKKLKIKVNIFERYDTLQNSTWFEEATSGRRHSIRDNKRLYRSGKSMKIQLEDLEGKCHVRHQNHIANMDLYKEQKNTFWLKEEVKRGIDPHGVIRREDLCLLRPEHIQYSAQSEEEIAFKREIEADFLENGTKLRAMEIFAGAGLMTAGLIAAFKGSLDFVSAVEFSPAACHTHSVNFPSCQVHCADGSVLLERAIRREQGEKLQPLRINDKVIPDLPRPGEIDFICGGPPCPGFSGMNRFKRSDDIKNSLIVLFLAYLDFYKPKYFLLENVAELLHSKLSATQITKHRMEGGIEQGMVKLILRACTSLGYQVQQAVLQAAEHNVPQNRQRVFFWASKIGWPLPKYPEVENLVHSTRYSTRNRWQNERRSAPQNIVTIGDAISDLPAFDWINPHGDYPICSQIEQEERRNRIEQYEIKKELGFVGRNEQSYASQPLSEFQRSMRNGVALTGLTNHVNEILNPEDIRRVCAVPLLPGCDHRDIPDENIKQGCLRKSNKSAVRPNYYDGRFGRLDMEDIFRTCVTTLHPLSKPGAVLHPTQHRVIAIREFARAMSLHDTFTFDLDSFRMKDVIRQIGNGAPTNLVKAVGMPLFEVLVEKHQREKTTKSATVSRERLKTKHLQQSMENSRGSRMGSSSQNAIEIIDSDDDEDDLSV
jgi:DNA-cytosine methyltransferase